MWGHISSESEVTSYYLVRYIVMVFISGKPFFVIFFGETNILKLAFSRHHFSAVSAYFYTVLTVVFVKC